MFMVRQEKTYFGRSTINKNVVFLYVQSLNILTTRFTIQQIETDDIDYFWFKELPN